MASGLSFLLSHILQAHYGPDHVPRGIRGNQTRAPFTEEATCSVAILLRDQTPNEQRAVDVYNRQLGEGSALCPNYVPTYNPQ